MDRKSRTIIVVMVALSILIILGTSGGFEALCKPFLTGVSPSTGVKVKFLNETEEKAGPQIIQTQSIKCHDGEVTSMCLSADGKVLMTKSNDDLTFALWDVETGECLMRANFRETFRVLGSFSSFMLLSPDATIMLTSHSDGTVNKWDISAIVQ